MVSKDFEHVNQEHYFAALEIGPSEKSQRENTAPSSEQDSKTGGLDCRTRELQRQVPTLSPSQEDQILM